MIQWLFAIVILVVIIIDFIHPCLLGNNPINGEDGTVFALHEMKTDRTVLQELKKAEALAAKKRVLKKKDPKSTARAQIELD